MILSIVKIVTVKHPRINIVIIIIITDFCKY